MLPFSDLDLARRLERAEGTSSRYFIEARAEAAPESQAVWMDAEGVDVLFDGPDSPITQTFGLGMRAPVTAELVDRIEGFFFERQAPVHHEVSPLAGVDLFRLLADRGYRPVEFTSVLYRSTDAPPFPSNPKIEVRAAKDDEYDLWARVSSEGWSYDMPEFRDFLLDIGRVAARKRHSLALLAWLDGKPIAAAGLALCGGVAHMAGSSTIPEARGKGAQLALLHARLKYAAEQGCDLVLMGTAPGSASQRNAERQGFHIAYTRQKWQLAL